MRDSMVFYRSFYEAIKELTTEQQGIIYNAIFSYGLDKKEPELNGVIKTIWTLIKPQIDANLRKYENGNKGGRPPKDKTEPKPNNNLNETKPKANVNVNDNDNVNANVNLQPTHVHNLVLANPEIPYEKIRNAINNHLGTRHMTYSKQVQLLITNLWANGVNLDDIERVVKNVFNDKWHKDKNFTSCAPHVLFEREFFDRYNFTPPPEAEENKNFGTAYGRW